MTEWIVFAVIVASLVTLDLYGFERKRRDVPSLKLSAIKTVFYVLVALAFGVYIAIDRGYGAGLQYLTGYSLEMSLSFDNVFVISLILGGLSIPSYARPRVLFYGILGALVLRGIFIGLGAAIVGQFHWVLLLFAAFLVYTGVKMLFDGEDDEEYDVETNPTLKWMRKHLPISNMLDGRKFFVTVYPEVVSMVPMKTEGARIDYDTNAPVRLLTPLFVALVLVEIADVIFAVDSIPATFAITTDPFLVFTSNIFAIIGLRSLFFVLEAMVHRFKYLTPALSLVLVFIGVKVLAGELLHWELPLAYSLGGVLGILGTGIIVSLVKTKAA